MTPNLSEQSLLTSSYKFEDSNDCVLITFYAPGAIEQKDLDVVIETDLLEVITPANQRWSFHLYDHVFADQLECKTKINESRTQTIIEIRLHKQQKDEIWPQLYSRQTLPITPNDHIIDQERNSSSNDQTYELAFKKVPSEFIETMDNRAYVQISIKEVSDCQIQFTETNFTVIFSTKDENFLQQHSIPSNIPIKLFVRVKERIKPDQCTHRLTLNYIEVTLVKDSDFHSQWYRLEPNEFTDIHSIIPSSPISTISPSINNSNSIIHNFNQPIPLPAPRSLDHPLNKYPLGSSFHQNDTILHSTNTTSIGYTGIYNPANSCFMNAAVQCLSNTRELRDYFLNSYYCMEINRTNPLGMQGTMAEEFAHVIKNLWSGQTNYIIANRLREYAGKRHQEFVGNGQHDAQELLTILLDALHEDLNRIINKSQVPPIEDENRTDEILANEYWTGYLKRNNSVIVQLFTGQFKSKTKCPQCQKESVTFDPFTSLSVPIPKRIGIDTIVIYRNEDKIPIKFRITLSADGSIGDFKRLLSHKARLPITKMLAYKMHGNRSIDYLKDDDRVTNSTYSWNNYDTIYITEILTSTECNNENIIQLTFFQRIFKLPDFVLPCGYCQALPNPHTIPKWCKNCYRISYCDEQCQKFHMSDHKHICSIRSSDNYEIIGLPFIVTLPESKFNCESIFEQIKIHTKHSVDIHIEQSQNNQRLNSHLNNDDEFVDDEDENFSDVETMDWTSIKRTLCSSDSWSICRIGDYFVKKKQQQQQRDTSSKETNSTMINIDNSSESSFDDFDMLEDIYSNQPLFRLMPQTDDYFDNNQIDSQPIIGFGEESDRILRLHRTFSIDWFTDNKFEAPLRVTPSKHRSGLNGLVEDESVFNTLTGDQDVTLQQCLQLFIEPEVLGPDDKWYCPQCKEHIQAEKKMSVWRLPPILIVHLKRFKYNHYSSFGYMSNSREKIDTNVKFPVYDLDMTPYCSSATTDNYTSQSRYDLYGIINHRGTAWFGHYTSYGRLLAFNDSAKTEIGWRHFDDQRVTQLGNVKDLVRSDAYVLFYRHRHLAVNYSFPEGVQQVLIDSIQNNQFE